MFYPKLPFANNCVLCVCEENNAIIKYLSHEQYPSRMLFNEMLNRWIIVICSINACAGRVPVCTDVGNVQHVVDFQSL